ncbi:MAG: DUF2804 domain-containing protein [Treponema sp.]|nr:DUF2804 domain-containing protein [Treponema sp.]MCL2272254.1 DUF2804 domain-containing protein [Treponema sp.]
MPQNEVISPLSVIDDKGHPHNFGWSKKPCFFYDPAMVYESRNKITEYDRYIVFSATHLVVFEIRDDGCIGYMGVSVISLRDKKRSSQFFKTFFPLGTYELPTSSAAGSVHWKKLKTRLDFICMDNGVKIIKADIPKFGHNRSMRGALVLMEPSSAQSLVTNQPWRNEKFAFRYARCSPWFSAEGVIQFGSSEIIFTKGNGWAIYDWNRCVRPKNDTRYWAAAGGLSSGRQLSLCVGYSLADFSMGTENGFFIDGNLHKLDQVTFHVPMTDLLAPWRFTSNDNRLEMTFHPHQERIDKRTMLFYNSTRRQVCGFFSGKVQIDDGSVIEFQNLTGFAERSKTRF